MSLERYELLELRGDDGVQTYHARDTATRKAVQVHIFSDGQSRDALILLAKVAYLPDADRRRILDRGMTQGHPFVVTDRLAGFASLREWLEIKSSPTLDQQFARLFEPAPREFRAAMKPDRPMALLVHPGGRRVETDADPMAILPAPLPRTRRDGAEPGKPPIFALLVGILAAVVFLVILIAVLAFRPHM